MKHMRPHAFWLAVPILAVACAAVAGCGLDNGLICGAACPGGGFGEGGNGVGDSAGGGPVDSAQPGESGSSDGAEAGDSMTGSVGDSAMPVDSAVGDSSDGGAGAEGGCQVCGLSTCCAPQQCASNNTSCCSGVTGPCGGDNGSCCSQLVCTTGQQCATSCNTTGSCMSQNDCCRGKSYCDVGNCTACRANNLPCTLHDQCCSGHCGVNDGGAICSGGN